MTRRTSRRLAAIALGLGLGSLAGSASAYQGKEPTDGFFDVPAREPGESYGVPAYMITSTLGGAAMFILCKSARRS